MKKLINLSAVTRATANTTSFINKIFIVLFAMILLLVSPLVLSTKVILKTEKGEAYISFSKRFREENNFPLEIVIFAIAVMVIAISIVIYSLLKAIGFFDIEIEYLLLGL